MARHRVKKKSNDTVILKMAKKKSEKEKPSIGRGKGTRHSFTYSTVRKKAGTTYSPKY